ncbi:MAG: hypothetical protein H6Q89_1519 [Myxococcaceae bacterium]|nr:hypothetical protein [Myxococcaceae bacterium]
MFAMFLLALVLLVMATLSLSHLTHQKMQMQVASDTAAYSQAVATARAFNSVALLNRAQLATMVAMAGIDSAVSFGGSYRAALNSTWYGYWNEFDGEYCSGTMRGGFSFPAQMCEGPRLTSMVDCRRAAHGEDSFNRNNCYGDTCRVLLEISGWGAYQNGGNDYKPDARLPLIRLEFDRVKAVWQALDSAAGLQARSVQSEAAAYGDLQETALGEARAKLEPFTTESLAVTGATANPASIGVAHRELRQAFASGISDNAIDAAMGSRAHLFITQRKDGARAIQTQLRRVLGPSGGANEVTVLAMRGGGYFASSKIHGARPATGYAAWGDEESRVTVNYLGPDAARGQPGTVSGNLRFEGWVGSTDRQNTTDQHNWCPEDFEPDDDPPDERHTMHPHAVPAGGGFDPCAASSCIWPGFLDANAGRLADAADVFGQPKLFATATKDLSAQKDPWNTLLTFKFSASGAGATSNFKAQHAVAGVQPTMQSLAAAMAYYHRPNHWKEPPNFFNPYWRATLVRANIDTSWKTDLAGSVAPQNAETLTELTRAGYEGIP